MEEDSMQEDNAGVHADEDRTTRSHAGEGIEDARNFPGYALVLAGLACLALALTAAGYGFSGWALILGVACFVALAGGFAWVTLEHRRVKNNEGKNLTDQAGH
jgi:protein-S-isoprenylcysteine O-methyltransferase Ste14